MFFKSCVTTEWFQWPLSGFSGAPVVLAIELHSDLKYVSVVIRIFHVYSKCTDIIEAFQATYFYRYHFLADSEYPLTWR